MSQPVDNNDSYEALFPGLPVHDLDRISRRMWTAVEQDAAATLGAAKDLVEASTKLALNELGETYSPRGSMRELINSLLQALTSSGALLAGDDANALTQLLRASGLAINTLRNRHGVGHGRSPLAPAPRRWHVALMAQSATAYATFILGAVSDVKPIVGLGDGALVKADEDVRIYVIYGGARFWVPSPPEFEALGYRWSDVQILPPDLLRALPTIPREGTVLIEVGNPAAYLVKGGRRYWMRDSAAFDVAGAPFAPHTVPRGGLDQIPEGGTDADLGSNS